MERQGYDISYISNWDTHDHGSGLSRARGFLSVGHDEYWTPQMFANMKQAIRAGLGVAFLSGNSVFCKIRLKSGTDGRHDRIFERTAGISQKRLVSLPKWAGRASAKNHRESSRSDAQALSPRLTAAVQPSHEPVVECDDLAPLFLGAGPTALRQLNR
jgi:hypothetical protein